MGAEAEEAREAPRPVCAEPTGPILDLYGPCSFTSADALTTSDEH
jgi:hypothetical protein